MKSIRKDRAKQIKLRRAGHLRDRYGISLDDYDRMLIEQDHLCAICHNECKTGRRLAVDHCHKTGKIRGLLCLHCNRGLGHFKDDPSLLEKAKEYLND